jgi:hypothetical protein
MGACTMKQPESSPYLTRLVQASEAGRTWIEASELLTKHPTKADLVACAAWTTRHPDHSAYHALASLLRHDSHLAYPVPSETHAKVLCDALARQTYLNDFAVLEPNDYALRPAGRALIAQGPAVVPLLRALLQDTRPAPLWGSEEATLATIHQYRRKDFAYFFLCQIEGRDYHFDADPAARDARIAAD